MRRALCGLCEETSRFKFATIYWRWTWPSGDQRGYKQFFDAQCLSTFINQFWDLEHEGPVVCTACTEVLDGNSVDVYATYYVPGQDRQDGYLPFHEACLTQQEQRFMLHAVRLADRDGGGVGPHAATNGNPWGSWEAQGISPRK